MALFAAALLYLVLQSAEIHGANLHGHFGSGTVNPGDIPENVLRSIDTKSRPTQLTPLVIVPSLIGSRIDAKLAKPSPDYWYCKERSDWFQLFVPRDIDVIPPFDKCWIENMIMSFDNVTGLFSGRNGIEYRIPYYGGVEGVEYLDDANKIGVWNDTIAILSALGYTPGKDIVSAPYDWRVGPTEVASQQFAPLKALIEQTYATNNNTPVALTSLSMGGLYVAVFLDQYVGQAWKDQHIAVFTSLSGAFGGSMDSTFQLLSLNPHNAYHVPAELFVDLTRGWGSTSWLLPVPAVFGDVPIVVTATRNYTAGQLVEMYNDAGVSGVAEIVKSTLPFVSPGAPGVPTNVVYGYNVSTLRTLIFNSTGWPNNVADFEYMDGDGTVTSWGLATLPRMWAANQTQPVKEYPIDNMLHDDGVHNVEALKILVASLGFTRIDV